MSDHLTDDALARVHEAATAQPSLFPQELGIDHGVVTAARRLFRSKSEPKHTGAISTRDEQRATAVLLCLQAGMSRRQIRQKLGVHHYTIDAIEGAAETGGRLEPLNKRIRDALGRLVLDATQEARVALVDGSRDVDGAAWLKSVATALGIATDKMQLLMGAPTEILEHRSGPGRADLEAWLSSAGLQVVSPAAAVDVESPADAPNQLDCNAPSAVHTSTPTAGCLDPAQSGPIGPAVETPGGGLQKPGAAATTDESAIA